MEITKNGLELCGKKYKFKKCTNAQILEHQKSIEAQQEKYQKIFDKSKSFEKDVELIDAQLEACGNVIKAIEKKDEPTDDELNLMIEKSNEQVQLFKERREILNKVEEMDKKHKKELDEIQDYIVEQYGELASLQLDGMTKEEFVKNSTSADMTIVRLLGSIRKMLSLGASTKDVEKFIKQNILEEAKQSFQ